MVVNWKPEGPEPEETDAERLNRNWADILQELRVIQTGSQIIAGFLLAAAFQQRFLELSATERGIYLGLVVSAVVTTALGMTPVVLHRRLFRMGAKQPLVKLGSQLLTATLVGLAITLVGIVLLIFEMIGGLTLGIVAAVFTGVVIVWLWVALPHSVYRRRTGPSGDA